MNFVDFEKKIKANFNLDFSLKTRKNFLIYKNYLQQENKKFNLTNLNSDDLI